MKKSNSIRDHAVAYNVLGALLLIAPRLLRLNGPASFLAKALGLARLTLGTFTNRPPSAKLGIPLRARPKEERWSTPAMVATAFLLSGWRRRSLSVFLGQTLLATTLYRLTSWGDPHNKRVSGQMKSARARLLN